MKNENWEWRAIATGFFVAYCFGCLGYFEYSSKLTWIDFFNFKEGSYSDRLSAAYYGLQMLVLNPPYISEPIAWKLHISRWFGAISFLWGTGKVINIFLYKEIQSLWHCFRTNHLIICGLDKFAMALALDAKVNGKRPVVVALDSNEENVKKLLRHGIHVIIGKPSDIQTLRRARLDKAETVFALCSDDETNIEIARQISLEIARLDRGEKLKGFFLLNNPNLRATLIQNNLFLDNSINIRWFDQHFARARNALFDLPLDHIRLPEKSGKKPRIIIVGFGDMGQSMAVQAARIAHFESGGKLQIHIVGQENQIQSLYHKYPNMNLVADLEWIGTSLSDPRAKNRITGLCTSRKYSGEILACAFCHDNANETNFIEACSLARSLEESKIPILFYQTTRKAFHPLMESKHIVTGLKNKKLIPFGMQEDIWTCKSIIDQENDILPEEYHQIYLEQRQEERKKNKEVLEKRPAEEPWNALYETYRESNRALVDHLPVKLHALELRTCPLKDCEEKAVEEIDRSKTEVLSKMEHARWCAERWLDGWSKGPRNDAAKIHDDLVPWNELNEHERKIDAKLINALSRVLSKKGLGLVKKS